MKRVVITGLGTVNPLGSTVEKFWENVKKGTLGVSKIDSFDTTELGVSVAGIIRDFDPAEDFERKDIRHMERFTQIAVASAIQALQDAGTDFKDMDPYRVGTIIGCGIGGIGRIEEEHDKYRAKGPGRISPFFVPMMIGNMAAGQVAIRTGFRGDNFCTTTACASATHAIGEAFRKIKDGYLDVCLCGGSESTITEFTLGGFRTMKALTTESDPAKASTPFDLNRGGFVLGEGSAVLVLEEYEHAKARGAKIYCELAGYGATCDAYHMTAPADECGASSKAMIEAYTEAGLKLYQCPRHLHTPERYAGNQGGEDRSGRGAGTKGEDQLHQVHDWSHAGRYRCSGSGSLCPVHSGRLHSPDHRLYHTGSGVRSGLLCGRSGRDAGECRTVQLAGLRRTQCDTLLQEVHRLRRIRHE